MQGEQVIDLKIAKYEKILVDLQFFAMLYSPNAA
jgi:hypothetical protein